MGIIGIFLVCWKEGWNKCCDWFCKTLSQPVVNMVRDSNKTAFLKLKICANNTTLTYSITHTSSPPPPMQSCFENDLQHSSNIDKGEGGVKMDTLKRWGGRAWEWIEINWWPQENTVSHDKYVVGDTACPKEVSSSCLSTKVKSHWAEIITGQMTIWE